MKQSEFRAQPETCHCIKPSPTLQHTRTHPCVGHGLSEIYMGRLLSLVKKEGKRRRKKQSTPLPNQFYFSLLCHYWLCFNFIKRKTFIYRNIARDERGEVVKPLECWILKYYSLITPFSLVLYYYSQHIYILEFFWLCNRYHCHITSAFAFQSPDNEAYSSKKGSLVTRILLIRILTK